MVIISRQIISYTILHSFDALLENYIQVHIIFVQLYFKLCIYMYDSADAAFYRKDNYTSELFLVYHFGLFILLIYYPSLHHNQQQYMQSPDCKDV